MLWQGYESLTEKYEQLLQYISDHPERATIRRAQCERAQAKGLFAEMSASERAEHVARFEAERLGELASPTAKAWKREGINSRIAASTYYRGLASDVASMVTDMELLEFAVSRGGCEGKRRLPGAFARA
jgi:hypothetical protein